MKFFTWISSVLSDPYDNAGSTARVCLMVLIMVIAMTLSGLVVYLGNYPDIPGSLSGFLITIIIALIGKIVYDRKTEAVKVVDLAKTEVTKGADNGSGTDQAGNQPG